MRFTRTIAFMAMPILFGVAMLGHGQEPLPPDVRLVIDVSGSMKRNDPNNLRQPAVELLVQLLPEDSRAGVWTFGRYVNMLVKHQDVDAQWREGALAKSSQINSAGLFTNIGDALEKAAYDKSSANPQHHRSIILLTDGMVDIDKDPGKNQTEWRRIADEVLPKLKRAGYTVHTIALSQNADRDLLNKLSLSTDGVASIANTAEDLMKIFLKAFDVAAPMEQVPLSDEGFVIDSSVEEFTALIFRNANSQPTQLVGPDQEVFTAGSQSKYVNWYRADNYDLITVKQPIEGQWQVVADMDPDSRVTVVSNLNVRVRPLPINVFRGQQESVQFLLQEDGATITDPNFLNLMTMSASLMGGRDEFDLREIWQQEIETSPSPGNGKFKFSLPAFEKEGIYQLSILVDGKSFIREFNHQFATRQPFGADIKQVFVDGRTEYTLTARTYNTDVLIGETQVVASILAPDGTKKIRPMLHSERDTWQTNIRPEDEGEYIAQVKVRGKTDAGEFALDLDEIRFNYSIDEGFVEEEEPFFEETPEPEPEPEPSAEPTAEATPEPEAEPQPETPTVEEEGMPDWLLYAALGLGNFILFGLGFLAFRKIMGSGNAEEVLDQFSEENVNQQVEQEPEPEAEPEDDFEEEPPMEDIDPAEEEPELEETPEPEVAEEEDIDLDDDDDIEMMAMDTVAEEELEEQEPEPAEEAEEEVEEQAEDNEISDFDDEPMDDLDDLEQMAVDAEDSDAADEPEEEEEEDMVSAMLKAQGLDLAEDELDDAISSLIDELENDDGFDDLDDDEGKT